MKYDCADSHHTKKINFKGTSTKRKFTAVTEFSMGYFEKKIVSLITDFTLGKRGFNFKIFKTCLIDTSSKRYLVWSEVYLSY